MWQYTMYPFPMPRMGYGPWFDHSLMAVHANDPDRANAALRDLILRATDASLEGMVDYNVVRNIVDLARDEVKRKIILDILDQRLSLGWPFDYKAVDLASELPPALLIPFIAKIEKLANPAAGVYCADAYRSTAGALLKKVKAEKDKKDEIEAKQKQEAIMGMWGGLWHNTPHAGIPATITLAVAPGGHPYPYVPPGLAMAPAPWASKAPDGWTAWVGPAPPVSPEAYRVPWCYIAPNGR